MLTTSRKAVIQSMMLSFLPLFISNSLFILNCWRHKMKSFL